MGRLHLRSSCDRLTTKGCHASQNPGTSHAVHTVHPEHLRKQTRLPDRKGSPAHPQDGPSGLARSNCRTWFVGYSAAHLTNFKALSRDACRSVQRQTQEHKRNSERSKSACRSHPFHSSIIFTKSLNK